MWNVFFANRLFIFLSIIIISIIVSSNSLHINLERPNNFSHSNKAIAERADKKVESSPVQTHLALKELVTYKTTAIFEQYKPRYMVVSIDPSNYGDRYNTDVYGNSLNNSFIIVLHETTNSVESAINTFKTPHPNDNNQVSYHTLISLDGTVIYLLSPDKRAFGAGNSAFNGETVKTNPNLAPSVNNFAYHVSLETPPDGWNKQNQDYHSGYTDSQYKSLAWLIAQSSVPENRITTHKDVDISGYRLDPRSFDFNKFLSILRTYRQPTLDKR